ncbi:MAG: BrnT family toxin [Candidatus Thiothrix sulfatifontis]|nr:MAG: BrnT family toxin [Candidatus Thiothrix sulfatifontis]
MDFEWDDAKNHKNIRKHKISFETAAFAFVDPKHVSIQDRIVDGEERWQTIGMVQGRLLLLVAHTLWDADNGSTVVRIISARRAEPKERKRYEQANQNC